MSLKRVHLGLSSLVHDRTRLMLSTCGISFAVIIMFLQAGFFNGINDTQANVARIVDADLVVLHRNRTNLNKWTRFDAIRVSQLRALPGVAKVIPIYKDGVGLRNPQTGQVRRSIIYAFPAEDRPFRLDGTDPAAFDALNVRGNAIFDVRSRPIYGEFATGDVLEVNGRPYRLSSFAAFGPTLVNDGTVLVGTGTWLGDGGGRRPIMALVRFDEPGASAREAFMADLPESLVAYTPDALAEREIRYTVVNAPIGAIFAVGLVVSIVIGTIICYQVLYNEVTDNIPQYATLKAMGFGSGALVGIILEKAVCLAAIGFVPGVAFTVGMYALIDDWTRLVMMLSLERVAFIFTLTLVMCVVAGLLAIRKVLRLDPADLY